MGGGAGGTATNVGSGGGGSLDLIPAPVGGGGGGGGGGGLAPLTIPAPGSGVMSRSHNDVSRCSEYQICDHKKERTEKMVLYSIEIKSFSGHILYNQFNHSA